MIEMLHPSDYPRTIPISNVDKYVECGKQDEYIVALGNRSMREWIKFEWEHDHNNSTTIV